MSSAKSWRRQKSEDELAAERAVVQTQTVKSFQRKRPSRKPFPNHLPRERVVAAAPESCPCCGSPKLSKRGEKFSCRNCDAIPQPAGGALSHDRRQTPHLQSFTRILQADAYSGYSVLYDTSRAQGADLASTLLPNARRKLFELADIAANAR